MRTWRVKVARTLRRWARLIDEQPTTSTGCWVVDFKNGRLAWVEPRMVIPDQREET